MLCMWKVGPYGQKLLGKIQEEGSRDTAGVGKRKWRTVSSWLAFNNLYSILHPEKLGNKSNFINTTERVRDIQYTLWLLREVWIKVGLEKLENHEGIAVRALLDSGATGLFMDTTFARGKGFKMEKLRNPLLVRNIDGMVNAGEAITYQVECNMFFKGHVERTRIDIYNLGKTEVIQGMPWLAAHNPEIDWEKGEVKMTCCPPIYGKRKQEGKDRKRHV